MKAMIYPEDIKEASRILKMHAPFGSKPWPGDVDFAVGKYSSALRKLVSKATDDMEGYPDANPEHVVSILSKFWDRDARQALYDTVNAIYSLPKKDVIHNLGSGRYSKDSYEKLFMRKLWFEVAKSTLDPAGKSDPSWIKENGQCLENLIPKKSTIPDAGFGGKLEQRGQYLTIGEKFYLPKVSILSFKIRICSISHSPRRNCGSSSCLARGQ
jgi:hypothetical protein